MTKKELEKELMQYSKEEIIQGIVGNFWGNEYPHILHTCWHKRHERLFDEMEKASKEEQQALTDLVDFEKTEVQIMETVIMVNGMMCPHCEAHVKKALEAIDVTIKGDNCKILYKERCGESNDIWESAFEVVSGKYFSTSVVKLHSNGIPARRYTLNYAHLDSFVIITCVGGGAALQYGTGGQMEIHCGDVVLLPADLEEVCFELAQGAKFEFLETHI